MPRRANSVDPADLIKQAVAGLDAQIKEWAAKRDQLARLLPERGTGVGVRRRGRPPGSKNKGKVSNKAKVSAGDKPKRKVSAATRRKLKEAARARWARVKAEQGE